MFKFNFQISDPTTDDQKAYCSIKDDDNSYRPLPKAPLEWRHFSKHDVSFNHLKIAKNTLFEELILENINLKYITAEKLDQTVQDDCPAEHQHSDLVPSIYEGGFKIWECTWDILNFITEHKSVFKGKRVLELGCGAGLLGIAAGLYGASYVTFQDYNEEVLNRLTIPNVILNFPNLSEEILNSSKTAQDLNENSQFKFYSGDWGNLPEGILSDLSSPKPLEEEKLLFDFILTSETIYNPENHSKLVNVFDRCLKSKGVVIVGAKTYYFGVGGGTHDFIRVVSEQKQFSVKTKLCYDKDVLREIIEIVKD